MALKNKSYDMVAFLSRLGLKLKNVIGDSWEYLDIRDHFLKSGDYEIEFINQHIGCTGVIPFKLELFQTHASEYPDDDFLGWGYDTGWGARLKGGCSFSIDYKNKKFLLECSYVACVDFGDGVIEDTNDPIYEGFDVIYNLFAKLFAITDDFKFYLY
jgi:hypothetical protein